MPSEKEKKFKWIETPSIKLPKRMSVKEISKIIQDTRQVGMLEHYFIGKDWADIIAQALYDAMNTQQTD